MNDRDDTEPTGQPDECAERTDPGQAADDTLPDAPEEGPDDSDTDAFLRWLPTMWLGHRRRKELVERPSSDGASFAAYACEGRPAPPSMRVRPEATVQVQPSPAPRSRRRGGDNVGCDSSSRERDAPTVLTRKRTAGARAALIGCGAVCVVAVSAAIAGWSHRPLRGEAAAGSGGAGGMEPVQVARNESKPSEPVERASAAAAFELKAEPPPANANMRAIPKGQKAVAALPSLPARKSEPVGATSVGIDTGARNRTSPPALPSAMPAKDQYFEAP